MKMKNITKWLAASAVFGLVSLASQRADAVLGTSWSTNSQYLLGTVVPGTLNGGQAARDAYMTNVLLGMTLGTQGDPNNDGSLFSRTTWPGGGTATAANATALTAGQLDIQNGIINIDLNHYGTFTYLVAAYDGPNGGVAVYNISGLTGTIQLYAYAHPELNGSGQPTGNLISGPSGNYFITTVTLLNPTSAPDGGATVMLLGAALGALGVARRYLRS
jgi:VPDSG-CTERM motif